MQNTVTLLPKSLHFWLPFTPNFSTHSLRKCWARQVYENENAMGRGEMALLKLSELMNHSDPSITRRYIGLRQQELEELYENLHF